MQLQPYVNVLANLAKNVAADVSKAKVVAKVPCDVAANVAASALAKVVANVAAQSETISSNSRKIRDFSNEQTYIYARGTAALRHLLWTC